MNSYVQKIEFYLHLCLRNMKRDAGVWILTMLTPSCQLLAPMMQKVAFIVINYFLLFFLFLFFFFLFFFLFLFFFFLLFVSIVIVMLFFPNEINRYQFCNGLNSSNDIFVYNYFIMTSVFTATDVFVYVWMCCKRNLMPLTISYSSVMRVITLII